MNHTNIFGKALFMDSELDPILPKIDRIRYPKLKYQKGLQKYVEMKKMKRHP
jgi:hypothetical protein